MASIFMSLIKLNDSDDNESVNLLPPVRSVKEGLEAGLSMWRIAKYARASPRMSAENQYQSAISAGPRICHLFHWIHPSA